MTVDEFIQPDYIYTSDENVSFFSALDYMANGSDRFCLVGDLNLLDFEWDLFLHPDNLSYNSAGIWYVIMD
jgi:hypothetical protein